MCNKSMIKHIRKLRWQLFGNFWVPCSTCHGSLAQWDDDDDAYIECSECWGDGGYTYRGEE